MAIMMKLAALGATAFALQAAPAARADGLPVLGIDVGRTGVSDVAGNVRYVALPTVDGTTVAAIARDGGRVRLATSVHDRFTIPAVSMSGDAAGLSHDNSTLVLIRPRVSFPQIETRLIVLDTRDLSVRRRITLPGDHSFDAIAPDGRLAYVIHYTSPMDFNQYEVLSLDLFTGQLDPNPILDPYEPDEEMAGLPLSRVDSPDGRWSYTLYDGNGGHPFVHALDTVGRTARCIDLDDLEGREDIPWMKLRLQEGRLRVAAPTGAPLAEIDRITFAVQPPGGMFAAAFGVLAQPPADA